MRTPSSSGALGLHAAWLKATLQACVVCQAIVCAPTGGSAAPSWSHKGIALGLFAEERDFDYGPLLGEIARTGATHVSIVFAYFQDGVASTRIAPHPRYSPSEETIERTVRQARESGLEVLLFPILRLTNPKSPSEWRGTIAPKDVARWWRSYAAYILRFAAMATRHRVAVFCVGSELESLDHDPAPWRPLIRRVRRVYSGPLLYSANWSQFERTDVWELVDIAGISAYFPLVEPHELNPALPRLREGWRRWRGRIARWWLALNKPLILSELGYRSVQGTAARPWGESTRHPVDLEAQANAYRAFFDVWHDAGFLDGLYLWNWFGWGGPQSGEFTPRGKPATKEICRWFGRPAKDCPTSHGMPWEPLSALGAGGSTP